VSGGLRIVEGTARVDDVDAFLDDLDAVGAATGTTVQAFDARAIVSREHLRRAVELANRAFDRGENVARDPGVEILLYAAGRRQIDRALRLGVSEGEGPVVVLVVVGAAVPGREDDAGDGETDAAADADATAARIRELVAPAETLGAYDPDLVRRLFDVTDRELAATDGGLPAAVLERVALLDVRK